MASSVPQQLQTIARSAQQASGSKYTCRVLELCSTPSADTSVVTPDQAVLACKPVATFARRLAPRKSWAKHVGVAVICVACRGFQDTSAKAPTFLLHLVLPEVFVQRPPRKCSCVLLDSIVPELRQSL